jgi:hypothetical protein
MQAQVRDQEFFKARDLFLAAEAGKLRRYGSRTPSEKSQIIANESGKAADNIRAPAHLIDTPKHFPQRMTAKSVVVLSPFELELKSAIHCRIHRAVMYAVSLRIGSGPPPVHTRSYHGNEVNASAFERNISSYGFKTFRGIPGMHQKRAQYWQSDSRRIRQRFP